jgi:hypothetical protein
MTTWTCVHKDRGGHRLFTKLEATKTESGRTRLWVADASGGTPDRTDDGELEISPGVDKVVLAPSHEHIVAHVAVLGRGGKQFTVGLSCGCALYLAREWQVTVMLKDPTLTESPALRCVVKEQT